MMFLEGYEQPTPLDFGDPVSEADYRADERLNFHELLRFRRDPRAFRDGYFDEKEETDAMRFGTALHAKLLTPDQYGAKVGVFEPPVNEKTGEPFGATTKAYREAREAFDADAEGKTIIRVEDEELIQRLLDEFNFHPIAPKVLPRDSLRTEVSIFGSVTYDGVNAVDVKGRIDAYGSAGLVDVKTTASLDDASGRERFRYTIYDYKYIVQLAFYHMILTQCYGAPFVPVWILAFEKSEPYRAAVYAPTRQVLEQAYQTCFAWLEKWNNARNSNQYHSRFDELQVLDKYDPSRDY